MFFNNSRGNGKPQASPCFLRAEEWIEEALLDFGGDTRAGVADIQNDYVASTIAKTARVEAGAQSYSAVSADALGGVLDEIDEHLLDLLGIDTDRGRNRVFARELNIRFFELRPKKCLDLIEELGGRRIHQMRFGRPGEKQDISDDTFEAINLIGNNLGIFMLGRTRPQVFLLNEEPGFNRGNWISNFVSDTGSKHSERGQLFVALDQCLALNQLDSQRGDEVSINNRGQAARCKQKQSERYQQQNAQVAEGLFRRGKKRIHGFAMGRRQFKAKIKQEL